MPDRPARARRTRPGLRAVLALILQALLLTGCAAIPSSGPVRSGASATPDVESGYRVEPLGPQPGATPQEVVRGFYLAGVGVDDDFAAARQFLDASRRSSWRPTARTVVHPLGALTVSDPVPDPSVEASSVSVDVSTPVTGQVDARGVYSAAGPGATLTIPLHLTLTGGQWRITDAPDLLLLDDPDFERVFRSAQVYFPDRSDQVMVPDERWVLDRSSVATTLVAQLLAGPSSSLAPAVTSGAGAGSSLGSGSVVVRDGLASVDLPRHFGDEPAESLRLLQQQLIATLDALPEVARVRVSVDGGALTAPAPPHLASTGSDADSDADSGQLPLRQDITDLPLVLAGGRVQRLSGLSLSPVSGLPDLSGAAVSSPAVGNGQYAVLGAGGTQLIKVGSKANVVLSGTALTPPSFDALGWLWSTSAACTGTVSAVGRNGHVVAVEAGWLSGRTVSSLRVAPDGARVLVASTGPAADVRVDVAALRRAADGTPQTLVATAASTTPWLDGVSAAAWVGEDDIAVLATAAPGSSEAQSSPGTSVWVISAGRPRSLGAPGTSALPLTLAAGPSQRSLLVGTADNKLWQLAGIDWFPLGVSASDPAYPG